MNGSVAISHDLQLKFRLAKNSYEIKYKKIVSNTQFLSLMLEKFEKVEL